MDSTIMKVNGAAGDRGRACSLGFDFYSSLCDVSTPLEIDARALLLGSGQNGHFGFP